MSSQVHPHNLNHSLDPYACIFLFKTIFESSKTSWYKHKDQTWIFPRHERRHIYFSYSSSLSVGIVRNSSTETTWRKVFWKWNYDDISRLPRAEMTSWDVLVVSVHALPKRWRRRQKYQANQNRMLTKRNVFTGPWCFLHL